MFLQSVANDPADHMLFESASYSTLRMTQNELFLKQQTNFDLIWKNIMKYIWRLMKRLAINADNDLQFN